jgi:hypothetical protein
VPFIRYNRDKRGYETTLVMHAYRTPQGGQQHRVLYLFRSPSNLGVGRRPLDEEVVEALEHTHPDLTFDWPGLIRERVETRPDLRQRPRRAPGRPEHRAGVRPVTPAPQPVVVDDQSLLGRVLGAAEAERLRRRYAELLQRIARRARTPEDRDRLSDRARRLNPDEWGDETGVRAGVSTVDAEMDAIVEELPQRRRGRRGGRRRAGAAGGPDSAPPGASEIIEPDGETDAGENQHVAGPDRSSDAGGDGRGVGTDQTEPGAEPDDLRREV